ncbi:hypothetical protein BB934_44505 (plasmid) [Microvirga ossetica]|uniref:Uncharacterized protein n=1 Tax=Microvirga ossetica TaxID=1882682 RepID=A0A1B2EZ73_9HYPH|nr:hypothetical protein BB934_44505 [Microvirga ossetica]
MPPVLDFGGKVGTWLLVRQPMRAARSILGADGVVSMQHCPTRRRGVSPPALRPQVSQEGEVDPFDVERLIGWARGTSSSLAARAKFREESALYLLSGIANPRDSA